MDAIRHDQIALRQVESDASPQGEWSMEAGASCAETTRLSDRVREFGREEGLQYLPAPRFQQRLHGGDTQPRQKSFQSAAGLALLA
jgi:hypothetical protein